MVLYISGETEKQALKAALGYYLLEHAKGDTETAVAKILARAIVCEMKQDNKKAVPKNG